jgi:hypothetical protein
MERDLSVEAVFRTSTEQEAKCFSPGSVHYGTKFLTQRTLGNFAAKQKRSPDGF